MAEPHPALDEVVDDLGDEDKGGLVIIEERSGPVTHRWVRFMMPVMVEVDCDDDTVTRVITLPEEIREDRDDLGHFCVYDEKFIRRHDNDQPQTHARLSSADGSVVTQHPEPLVARRTAFSICPSPLAHGRCAAAGYPGSMA